MTSFQCIPPTNVGIIWWTSANVNLLCRHIGRLCGQQLTKRVWGLNCSSRSSNYAPRSLPLGTSGFSWYVPCIRDMYIVATKSAWGRESRESRVRKGDMREMENWESLSPVPLIPFVAAHRRCLSIRSTNFARGVHDARVYRWQQNLVNILSLFHSGASDCRW